MIELRNNDYRARGLQLVTLLLIVSFAFIPVRCDASTAPHSIFVDPVVAERAGDAQARPSAGSNAGASMHHQHHAGMVMADQAADSDASTETASQEDCAIVLDNGADLSSQQPVGAALDLPTTPVPPNEAALIPLDGEPIVRSTAPVTAPDGVLSPPDAPPPKSF